MPHIPGAVPYPIWVRADILWQEDATPPTMPLSNGSKILAITAAGASTGPSGDRRLVILAIVGGCVRNGYDFVEPAADGPQLTCPAGIECSSRCARLTICQPPDRSAAAETAILILTFVLIIHGLAGGGWRVERGLAVIRAAGVAA
jgi:hypothetical protein